MAAGDGQLWSCAQVVMGRACDERQIAMAVRPAELPLTHVRLQVSGIARLLEAVKPLLRWLARGLWLFVPAVLVKLVLRVIGIGLSDYITFVFVLYVVGLFSVLSLVVMLQWLAGPRSARPATVRLDLPSAQTDPDQRMERVGTTLTGLTSPEQLAAFAQQHSAQREGLRLRGTLSGGRQLAPGTPLLVERWERRERGIARYLLARPFAVIGTRQPAVWVDLTRCVALLSDYRQLPQDTPAELPIHHDLTQFAGGRLGPPGDYVYQCVLRQGDAVELSASAVAASLPAAQLPFQLPQTAHEADPYRGGQERCAVVESNGHASLMLRSLGPAALGS